MKPNLKSQRGNPSQTSREELKEFATQNSIAREFLLLCIDDILNILPPSLYSVADSRLDKQTINTRFDHEGLAFATLTLPKLSAGLFLYLETGQVCYPSFYIKKGTVHPVFLQGLFRLACCDGEFQVVTIRAIYQISVMFKKLRGPYPDSVLSKQLADFVRVDSDLGNLDWFAEPNLPILERAREEVRRLFAGFSLNSVHVLPRPGPGATNQPVEKHMRFRPHVLYTQIDRVMPYVDFFVVNGWDIVHQTARYQRLYSNVVGEQRARFKFVQKQVGKARGICIEQNETQFLQQALKRALYDWIQKNTLTKGRINFDDQTINAKLALSCSIDRSYSTIDMSDASDRVARELVSWLFQDTEIHDALMGLSTKWIDLPFAVDGQRAIKTTKYAPMGSGLCFPIMSVVHWALIRSMIACSMFDPSHMKEVYVYGDDIIIPTELTEMIYTYLPRFGMKVNTTKSYYRSYFRESCGIHAYKGVDITPLFIKHLPVSSSFQAAMSCIAVEYEFNRFGYCGVASLLRSYMRKAFTGYEFPYVSPASAVFGFKRDGVTKPEFPGRVKVGVDSWGNPVQRVRVVTPITESFLPPTEEESYLRHVLTKDVKKEVSGNPREFKLKWKTLPIPGAPFSVPDEWKYVREINQPRSERDKKEEEKYDFTNPVLYQPKCGQAPFQWRSQDPYCDRVASRYSIVRICDPCPAWRPDHVDTERSVVVHRVSRYALCRDCTLKVACGNYPDISE